MTDTFTGLILAGGASRRFGQDKARAPVGGRPMVARVHAALAAVTAEVLLSVRTGDDPYGLPVRVVRDPVPGAGPLAGLVAGLRACRTDWLLVVACDMPLVTPAALAALAGACAPGVQAVVAEAGGRRHPLCAVYHRAVRPHAEAHLAAGRLALHALLDVLDPVRIVPLPEAAVHNVNRPDDLPPDP